MFLTTTEHVPGAEYTILGLVRGSAVCRLDPLSDWVQGITSLVGGELEYYTKLMSETRELATERMTQEAERLYADAIVSVRYASSEISQGAAEVITYGTAVKFLT